MIFRVVSGVNIIRLTGKALMLSFWNPKSLVFSVTRQPSIAL